MDLNEIQNPASPAPLEIIDTLEVIRVRHLDFNGAIQDGVVVMNRKHTDDILSFFETALELNFPIASVRPIHEPPFLWDDIVSCNNNNSSGFNYRTIMGSDQLSKHSYGNAFDINPRQNIYIRFDAQGSEIYHLPEDGAYDSNTSGTLTGNHPLVLLMKERGWTWGGDWTKESGRIDYQHFEK